ncbi:MAG TPA: AMP-binding protein [Kofleriaceae bacterium]
MGMDDYTSRYTKGLALEHAYHWERTRGDKPWLVQPVGNGEVRALTWAQGMAEARRMAAHLRSLDLPPASNIAIISKSTAHWILTDLAIMMAGHVSVPLYSTANAQTIRQILDHSAAKLLFVGKLDSVAAVTEGAPAIAKIALPLAPPPSQLDAPQWADVIARHEPLTDSPVRKPDELATIVYTSGSTGVPKGVMVTFGAIARAVIGLDSIYKTSPDDRMLSHLPLAHVAERWVVECGSLFGGIQVFFPESLETFLTDLRRARPTLFFTVPRIWQKFQLGVFSKLPPAKLDRLLRIPLVGRFVRKKILRQLGLGDVWLAAGGAAPMPADMLSWYRRLGLQLLEGYGMTENFGYSHGNRIGRVRPGYVGEPLPGVEHRIADDGEVQVKSPGMMTGYYKDPDLTAQTFTADGWLRTGDRGELDAENRLRITGRVKELFKTSKGKYVSPAPIENLLANHPFIEAVCVSGAGRPQPHALIMLGEDARKRAANGDRTAIEASLAAHLTAVNAQLESHETLAFAAVVRDVWQPDNGFLTPTLKIKRAEIERAYEASLDGWYETKQPVVWQG